MIVLGANIITWATAYILPMLVIVGIAVFGWDVMTGSFRRTCLDFYNKSSYNERLN